MLNNKPNKNKNYKQGNFMPKNRNKIIKFNADGGIYYRSGLELSVMQFLDINPQVTAWGCEFIEIPYTLVTKKKNGETITSQHRYYPDVYYEMALPNNRKKVVIMEIKPESQTKLPAKPAKITPKSLNNYEYALNEYNRNMYKWTSALKFCERKDYVFIIVTEQTIDKYLKGKL